MAIPVIDVIGYQTFAYTATNLDSHGIIAPEFDFNWRTLPKQLRAKMNPDFSEAFMSVLSSH